MNDAAIATMRAGGMRYRGAVPFGPLLLAVAAPDPAHVDLLILAGQSNMSGRGDVAELLPDERRPDPRILLYANDGGIRPAAEPIDSALGQIDAVSADAKAGVGPGLFAARRLAGGSASTIGLLPCAKGGSTLAQWRPSEDPDSLYGSCLRRIRAAPASPAAILWYQGESDARGVATAAAWPALFRDLVDRWRGDLGRSRLPVVVVSLADPPTAGAPGRSYPGWSAIRTAQRRLAIRCLVTVAAAGLPRNADQLHLSTSGQRTLSLRIARAVGRLRRAGCH